MNCPSCMGAMVAQQFEGNLFGTVALDFCYPCNAIWFDHLEGTQLSPSAVIRLFRLIHEHRNDTRRPLASWMTCVRCREPLTMVQDLGIGGRFSYYRCAAGHGRLTTFFQFLREKQFVRNLSEGEIADLKVKVAQVRCSSCGGPVDLQRNSACPYCRSPIAVLDAEAVDKTLRSLDEKDEKRTTFDPAALADAMIENQRHRARPDRIASTEPGSAGTGWRDAGAALDLVADCISLIAGMIE